MAISALLALLSGILYVLSFAPWDQAYLQWIAFIPLFYAVERLRPEQKSRKNIFALGFILSFLIGAGGFYWTIYATQQYGGLPYPASVALFLLFCIAGQLQVPIYLFLRENLRSHSKLKGRIMASALLLGLAYAGIEAFYPKLFKDTAGNAFYASSWVRQAADIGGPFFLTTLVLIVNELLFAASLYKKIKYLLATALLGALIASYGFYRNYQYADLKAQHAGDPVFRASLIQANIGDYLKVAAERGEISASAQVMNDYLNLSKRAMADQLKPDAIIWPETAYPAIFQKPLSGIEMQMETLLRGFTHDLKASLIFGGYDIDSKRMEYNSLFFYDPQTQTKQVYHKSVLLMFGETLPFAESFPEMKSWFPTMGFFGQGPGPQVYEVKNQSGQAFKFAPSICYEGLFTDHSVEGALKGADVLLNVTNDSWFGPDGEPYLHLALTRFRTIETRRPMIRATNTGFTVWIDPMGNQLKTTELFKPDILNAEVQNHFFPESPYLAMSRVFGGNWYVRLCELIALVALIVVLLERVRKNTENTERLSKL
ncbi:MAG: apolipoprotein N-acyltransferase [Bdellovibrionales bacterium]|nr:apolipoprotein N-acyltransferase [Oligoflexia bacterium]